MKCVLLHVTYIFIFCTTNQFSINYISLCPCASEPKLVPFQSSPSSKDGSDQHLWVTVTICYSKVIMSLLWKWIMTCINMHPAYEIPSGRFTWQQKIIQNLQVFPHNLLDIPKGNRHPRRATNQLRKFPFWVVACT